MGRPDRSSAADSRHSRAAEVFIVWSHGERQTHVLDEELLGQCSRPANGMRSDMQATTAFACCGAPGHALCCCACAIYLSKQAAGVPLLSLTCVGTLQLLRHTDAQPACSKYLQRSTCTPIPLPTYTQMYDDSALSLHITRNWDRGVDTGVGSMSLCMTSRPTMLTCPWMAC